MPAQAYPRITVGNNPNPTTRPLPTLLFESYIHYNVVLLAARLNLYTQPSTIYKTLIPRTSTTPFPTFSRIRVIRMVIAAAIEHNERMNAGAHDDQTYI